MASVFVSTRCGSISARTVNVYVPATVGVPEMSPSVAPSVRPVGSAPAAIAHVFESTEAVICSEYGELTVPTGTPACSGPIVSFGWPLRS